MKLKISYSVEIFEFQYKIEKHSFDEGYFSESEMVKQEKCKFCERSVLTKILVSPDDLAQNLHFWKFLNIVAKQISPFSPPRRTTATSVTGKPCGRS